MKKEISLATLNLWRFYEWETRLPAIVALIKKIDPDIIFLQEAQRNLSIDERNQVEILNAELGYPYSAFAIADMKLHRKGVPFEFPVEHGLGVLSKFPFASEIIPLTKAADDREKRIALKCDMQAGENRLAFTNVHFSNSDSWAENHFKELLRILKEKGTSTVLAGDFNIFNIAKYREAYGSDYTSSSEQFQYISYPEDGDSLDYVLIPKGCSFKHFECRQECVSDHRMLVARIEMI